MKSWTQCPWDITSQERTAHLLSVQNKPLITFIIKVYLKHLLKIKNNDYLEINLLVADLGELGCVQVNKILGKLLNIYSSSVLHLLQTSSISQLRKRTSVLNGQNDEESTLKIKFSCATLILPLCSVTWYFNTC